MNLDEAKQKVATIAPDLADAPFVVLHTFERNRRLLHLALTERFYRACRKGKVWQSQAFLTAIKMLSMALIRTWHAVVVDEMASFCSIAHTRPKTQ